MNDRVNEDGFLDMTKLTSLKGEQYYLVLENGHMTAYRSMANYYAKRYPRLTGVSMDTGRWDGKPRVVFQYLSPNGDVWEETHKYHSTEEAQKHYDAIAEAMEKGEQSSMDIYTVQEEAYKRGKEAGERGAMVWVRGAEIPDTVQMALIQLRSGDVYLRNRPLLTRCLQDWGDIVAWCEVKPMSP